MAETSAQARRSAAAAFTHAAAERPLGSNDPAALRSPWLDPELVGILPAPAHIVTDLPLGSVIAPDHACSFIGSWQPRAAGRAAADRSCLVAMQ